mgnify:CR=1 FL=1
MKNYFYTSDIKVVNKQLTAGKPVLLKIGHQNCPPCVRIKPVIEELAKDVPEMIFVDYDITFLRTRQVNEAESVFLENHSFRGVPYFSLYRNGQWSQGNTHDLYALIAGKQIERLKLLTSNPTTHEGEE